MRRLGTILVLPWLVVVLSGWFWSEKKEEGPVVTGVWKSVNSNQAVTLNFDSNGNFKADLENNGQSDITGEYRVIADQIIFSDDQTTSDTWCRDKAYYYFKVSGDRLRLTLIADACLPRRGILPGDWELISSLNTDKKKKKSKPEECLTTECQ